MRFWMAKVDPGLARAAEEAAGVAAFMITSKPGAFRSLRVLQTSIRSIRAMPSLHRCPVPSCWPSYYLRRSLEPRGPGLALPDATAAGSMTGHEQLDARPSHPAHREHGSCFPHP